MSLCVYHMQLRCILLCTQLRVHTTYKEYGYDTVQRYASGSAVREHADERRQVDAQRQASPSDLQDWR